MRRRFLRRKEPIVPQLFCSIILIVKHPDSKRSEDEDELEYEDDWGLRTIERKEKRAIEYQIFLEISSSYLVFVLQS